MSTQISFKTQHAQKCALCTAEHLAQDFFQVCFLLFSIYFAALRNQQLLHFRLSLGKPNKKPTPVSSSGHSNYSGQFLPQSCSEQLDLCKGSENDFLVFHTAAPILFHAKANKCIYSCLAPLTIMYGRLKSQFRSQQILDSNVHYVSGGQCSSRETQSYVHEA